MNDAIQPKNTSEKNPEDTAQHFHDPTTIKTAWTPLCVGRANFRTHQLVHVNANRVKFRMTAMTMSIPIIALAGWLFPYFVILSRFLSQEPASRADDVEAIFVATAITLIAVGVTVLMLRPLTKPIVFDKQIGFFWKGRQIPTVLSITSPPTNAVELERIYALQLITEYAPHPYPINRNRRRSYELNLVLDNGTRLNVIYHNDATKLREDAAKLSEFLGKPVWDSRFARK